MYKRIRVGHDNVKEIYPFYAMSIRMNMVKSFGAIITSVVSGVLVFWLTESNNIFQFSSPKQNTSDSKSTVADAVGELRVSENNTVQKAIPNSARTIKQEEKSQKIPVIQKDLFAVLFSPVTTDLNERYYNLRMSLNNTQSLPIHLAIDKRQMPIIIDDKNIESRCLTVSGIERLSDVHKSKYFDEKSYVMIDPGQTHNIVLRFDAIKHCQKKVLL
jgi:hypothetical protein